MDHEVRKPLISINKCCLHNLYFYFPTPSFYLPQRIRHLIHATKNGGMQRFFQKQIFKVLRIFLIQDISHKKVERLTYSTEA
jgi:hypothetical protein